MSRGLGDVYKRQVESNFTRSRGYRGHSLYVDGYTNRVNLDANNTDYLEYTIQKGDVLSEIAIRFGVTVESIKVTNNIGDNPIYPGQIIYVYLRNL